LLGRDREREVLDRLLDGVRGSRGGALVVHGEAGAGESRWAASLRRSKRLASSLSNCAGSGRDRRCLNRAMTPTT
jgi:hypothetical protein